MNDLFSIPEELEVDRELGSRSLYEFVKMAWPQVLPGIPFMPNWHIEAICEHLEAVSRRDIKRLVINVPPGTSKSLTVSVFWPTWEWTHTPRSKFITASFSDHIARRDALRSRHLLETEWYQDRWGDRWRPIKDDWSGTQYRNSRSGFRLAVTVSGGVTGEHADYQMVDDPIKPLDARGAMVDSAKLELCRLWWDETMTSRVADPLKSARLMVMQRLHDQDLAGHVLGSGDYVHLNLPMRYEKKCVVSVPHKCSLQEDAKGNPTPATPIGFKDERSEGDLLWKERFPEPVLQLRKKEMGSRGVASQDQQRPVPAGGGIFKRDWVQHWRAYDKSCVQYIQSWDCTFKKLDDADFVVGQVWAKVGGYFYLVDQVRDQMSVSGTCKAVASMSAKWPKAICKLIEDKANGPAVIQLLEKQIPGLIAVNPQGGKVARAQAVEPIWESGCVWLPSPEVAPWIHDFVEELVSFSGDPGRHDDQVDAMTQALIYLYVESASNLRQALAPENLGW